jgi:Family of unknown function (DUF6056)
MLFRHITQLYTKNTINNIGFWIITIVFLLPFFAIAFYNHPIGMHEWDWITNLNGTYDGKFWEYQGYYYNACMGRFSSTFLMSLMPYWYSLLAFQLFFILILLLLFAAIYFFSKNIFQNNFSQKDILKIAIGLFICYLAHVSNLLDTIYSYSSVLTYQIGGIATLFFFGLWATSERPKWSNVLLFSLALLIPGINEISMLAVWYVWFWLFCLSKYEHKKLPPFYWQTLFFLLLGTVIYFAAPGNYARMTVYNGNFGMAKAIAITAGSSLFTVVSWFSTAKLLLFSILVVPFLLKNAQKETIKSRFKYPLLYLGLSLLFVPVALFPMILGTKGASYAERVIDLTFLYFLCGFLIFLQALAVKYFEKNNPYVLFFSKIEGKITLTFIGFFLFNILIFNDLRVDRTKKIATITERININSNAGNLYKTLIDGSAREYDAAVRQQYEIVKQNTKDTCFVTIPKRFPFGIYDPINDRRHLSSGEPYMGYALTSKIIIVRYK